MFLEDQEVHVTKEKEQREQESKEAYQEEEEEEALLILPSYGGYLTQATPATVLISCSSTQSLQEGPLAPPRGDPATPPSLTRSLHLQDLLDRTDHSELLRFDLRRRMNCKMLRGAYGGCLLCRNS